MMHDKENNQRFFLGEALFGLLCLVVFSGCKTVDYAATRQVQSETFTQDMLAKTAEILPATQSLNLDRCIAIAMDYNFDIRLKDLQSKLARMDRQAAFGNFLPLVELNYSYSTSDPLQKSKAGGTFMQVSDRDYTYAKLNIQQPIFVPQAWLMYSMRQKGEDISDLVSQRTRQLISLQVTGEYFTCLSLEASRAYWQQAVKEAKTLLAETQSYVREGLATPAQQSQVEMLLLSRQNSLAENRRQLRQAKADLLESMGLYPFADIELALQEPYPIDKTEMADLILEAMLNRLELKVSDRDVEIRKDETRMAIADFLPNLFGIGSLTYNSDSFLKYSSVWAGGIAGVMTLFDGFQNIQQYRSSREKEKLGILEREQLCLTLMLEVVKARLQVDRTEDQIALAEKNLSAQEDQLTEIKARWREGLIQLSDYLEVTTRRDEALNQLTLARFQQQVALAALADVTGRTQKESEVE